MSVRSTIVVVVVLAASAASVVQAEGALGSLDIGVGTGPAYGGDVGANAEFGEGRFMPTASAGSGGLLGGARWYLAEPATPGVRRGWRATALVGAAWDGDLFFGVTYGYRWRKWDADIGFGSEGSHGTDLILAGGYRF